MAGWKRAGPNPGGRLEDGTVFAGVSPDTGHAIYTTPTDAPGTYTFYEALTYADKLAARGYSDWRLPTRGELEVLFDSSAAIGGFDKSGSFPAGWYWSSTPDHNHSVWAQRFSDGHRNNIFGHYGCSLRCVRGYRRVEPRRKPRGVAAHHQRAYQSARA